MKKWEWGWEWGWKKENGKKKEKRCEKKKPRKIERREKKNEGAHLLLDGSLGNMHKVIISMYETWVILCYEFIHNW